ncbi:MAG: calcium/sodium antiporter [Planctomycetota bacterium]
MTLAILMIIGGIALLGGGGDFLVRGASTLALRLRITPAAVGLTVVALGTSLPELVVSLVAQFRDKDALVFGNVVGSNLFNIGAVLGLGALIRPMLIPGNTVRLEWPFMLTSAYLVMLCARDSLAGEHLVIDRLEGAFFVVALVFFTAYMLRLARREVTAAEQASLTELVAGVGHDPGHRSWAGALGLVFGGAVGLAIGAELTVRGSITVAELWGVSDRIIGLAILAPGTSLPELVATIAALLHRKSDIAVGNVIGSNIFNALGILGLAALVRPLGVIPEIIHWDLWWMLGMSVVLGPFISGRGLNRLEGAILLLTYVVYCTSLAVRTG